MKRPNHLLHGILSLLTAGLWLPVWAVIAYRDGKRQRIARDAVLMHEAQRHA